MVTLDAATVNDITARARQIKFGRVLLTLLAGLLYGIGWLAYKTFAVAWLALTWSATAVALGWRDARKTSRRE